MFEFLTIKVIAFSSLGATYAVHLRLIGKSVVDFLFLLIELHFARCYDQGAWVNIDWKSAYVRGEGGLTGNVRYSSGSLESA